MSPVERRRDPKPRLTITQVVDRMQRIADEKYHGDVENNALAIFNQLSVGDRKTFLRKSLILIWSRQIENAAMNLSEIVIDQEIRIDQEAVVKERQRVLTTDRVEQQRLKTWMTQAFFVIGVVSFAVMILGSIFMGDGSAEGLFKHLGDIVKVLVG